MPILPIDILLPGHVAISLIAIATGVVAMPALAFGRWIGSWQAAFLVTTALTSLTGFMFPFGGMTPAILFGILSTVALILAAVSIPLRRRHKAAGVTYVLSATLALYLNAFVLIVQAFQKVSVLQPLAPTQSEPPFAVAQIVLLVAAIVLAWLAIRHVATDPRAMGRA